MNGHLEEARRFTARMDAAAGAASPASRAGFWPVKQRFIQRFGHIPYRKVQAKPAHWRATYAATASCELGCGAAGAHGDALVFDHCHRHGWVRGLVCTPCNTRLGHIEAVMAIPGVRVDLGRTPWGQFLANCPDCTKPHRQAARQHTHDVPAQGGATPKETT